MISRISSDRSTTNLWSYPGLNPRCMYSRRVLYPFCYAPQALPSRLIKYLWKRFVYNISYHGWCNFGPLQYFLLKRVSVFPQPKVAISIFVFLRWMNFSIGYPLIRHLVLFDELANCAIRIVNDSPHFSYEQDWLNETPVTRKRRSSLSTDIKLNLVWLW